MSNNIFSLRHRQPRYFIGNQYVKELLAEK
jgi:hypothetical protein